MGVSVSTLTVAALVDSNLTKVPGTNQGWFLYRTKTRFLSGAPKGCFYYRITTGSQTSNSDLVLHPSFLFGSRGTWVPDPVKEDHIYSTWVAVESVTGVGVVVEVGATRFRCSDMYQQSTVHLPVLDAGPCPLRSLVRIDPSSSWRHLFPSELTRTEYSVPIAESLSLNGSDLKRPGVIVEVSHYLPPYVVDLVENATGEAFVGRRKKRFIRILFRLRITCLFVDPRKLVPWFGWWSCLPGTSTPETDQQVPLQGSRIFSRTLCHTRVTEK